MEIVNRQYLDTVAIRNSIFMSRVYRWMMIGVFITGVVSFIIGINEELVKSITLNTPIFILMIIAQFGIVIGLGSRIDRMSTTNAKLLFILYSIITGITLSLIFLVYTMTSIQSAFFTTALGFAGLSFFGYLTKKDLGPLGSFCMMGLFGMIGYSILALFFPAMMGGNLGFTYSMIGLLIFSGLTAYDTQKIKEMGMVTISSEEAQKVGILGALTLYLDFINLFLLMLRFSSHRRK